MCKSFMLAARGVVVCVCVLFTSMMVNGCDRQAAQPASPSGEWRGFDGSWNATGTRRNIPLGDKRMGSIIELRGTMLLSGEGRPGAGFRAEVIALVDSETGLTGRGVWTDERGDQVFSELTGQGTSENNRIIGTLLGGTGSFKRVTGSFEFSWQFVIEAEDGSIQGRAVDLRGRFRIEPAASEDSSR